MKKIIIALLILIVSSNSWALNLLNPSLTYIPQDSLGSERISNGTFTTDTVWNKSTGWTISGGFGVATGVANTASIFQSPTPTAGRVYTTVFQVVTLTIGGFAPSISGSVGTTRSSIGIYTENLVAGTSGTNFGIRGIGATTSGTIDNASVRELAYAVGTKSFHNGTTFIQNLPGTLSGDTAGVWSIVSGPGVNGKAYQIANTGSTDVVVTLTTSKALTVGRSYRPIVIAKRTVGSGTPTFKLTGGTAVNITSATFVSLAAPAKATNTTDKPTFTIPAGCTIQFYEPKLLTLDNLGRGMGKIDDKFILVY